MAMSFGKLKGAGKQAAGDFTKQSYGSKQTDSGKASRSSKADGSSAADSAIGEAAKGLKKRFRKPAGGKS